MNTYSTQLNDMDTSEMLRITESIRPIINNWLHTINVSDKVHKDMVNVMESFNNGEDTEPPILKIYDEEVLHNRYRYQIYNNKNAKIAESVIPNDLLANKLSKDKHIKAIKEIKAISFDNNSNIYIEFADRLPAYNTFVVNEVYFGKTPNLIAIENKFRDLRNTITPDNYPVFDTLPIVEDINTLFEVQFGMELFSLHLEPDPIPNAWTIPVGYKFDMVLDKSLKKFGIGATSRDGFKFKPNNGIAIIATITSGLLFRQDIMPEEIVAILLHEIGHNFQDYIDGALLKYDSNYILNIYDYYMEYATLNTLYAYKADIQKSMSNTEDYESIISPDSDQKKTADYNSKKSSHDLEYFAYAFSRLLNVFTLGIPAGILAILKLPIVQLVSISSRSKKKKEFMGRTAEMTADKFATVYGYGAPLASALSKITADPTKIDIFINKIPFLGALLTIERIPDEMLVDMVDEHPSLVARIDDQIFTIQEELKKTNMSSECRMALEADLKQLQECKDGITSKGNSLFSTKGVQNYWNRYLEGNLDKNSTEKVSKRLNEEMDKLIKKS